MTDVGEYKHSSVSLSVFALRGTVHKGSDAGTRVGTDAGGGGKDADFNKALPGPGQPPLLFTCLAKCPRNPASASPHPFGVARLQDSPGIRVRRGHPAQTAPPTSPWQPQTRQRKTTKAGSASDPAALWRNGGTGCGPSRRLGGFHSPLFSSIMNTHSRCSETLHGIFSGRVAI